MQIHYVNMVKTLFSQANCW